ncbi:4-diphosphocytidyl-2C-methyl-D-erythritol kinase [Desulfosporosinus orientis DSM 765]|uniref:4-diphosphocytidyl-2-C-methyl-D-erythritol kinase n=1 Tax=Desulfosporosinus orientis (strain ATCC 19365 / DSM 765 / NCIMB 8382 / VKM B-1628 / Singapore I) TaxID=768706 RepID=G7W7E0_DESOD|nr:4-(cytidine 5'-diphospho)-2-C-methyl-D-erythritol kinase [Desulfosporosinus orientis]AET65811.1 4-diphosphocytidyl-2C-methyl-D-erythritol kinase [Desulfosporosinus orientis DSM 765]
MEQSFLTTFANAKINLALAIQGIQEDGYHELQSVMQSIELHDIVRVRRHGEKVVCRCGALSGPGNLAYKAAIEFLSQSGKSGGLEIEIKKQIPIQAGLAGGSTDAAATLRLLNQLYGNPFNNEELLKLAAQCGADVAFCLQGGTMWATGRGEQLELLPAAPRVDLVIMKPYAGVNTREAYRRFDLVGHSGQLTRKDWEEALAGGSIKQIAGLLYNDLEAASIPLVPQIDKFKQSLLESGCYGSLMSGSGSSVFGIAQGEQHARQVAEQLRKKGFRNVWVTKTIGAVTNCMKGDS